jgi:hypothetical protein
MEGGRWLEQEQPVGLRISLSGTRHPSWRENFSIVPAKKCLMIFRAARLGNGVSAEVDG